MQDPELQLPLYCNGLCFFCCFCCFSVDVLISPAGTSTGEVSIWHADPAAADAESALTSLGTAMLPDQQTVLVLDVAVVAAAPGWQLLLAAGKTLGRVVVWRSGVVCPVSGSSSSRASYGRQQLAVAVAAGSSSSSRCHGCGFVTGVCWNPWEQLLLSCGSDGQLLTWQWKAEGLVVSGIQLLLGATVTMTGQARSALE
jgi:hypothetical protein